MAATLLVGSEVSHLSFPQCRNPISASGTDHEFTPFLHLEGLRAQLTPAAEGFPTDPGFRLPERQAGYPASPDMASHCQIFAGLGGLSPGE